MSVYRVYFSFLLSVNPLSPRAPRSKQPLLCCPCSRNKCLRHRLSKIAAVTRQWHFSRVWQGITRGSYSCYSLRNPLRICTQGKLSITHFQDPVAKALTIELWLDRHPRPKSVAGAILFFEKYELACSVLFRVAYHLQLIRSGVLFINSHHQSTTKTSDFGSLERVKLLLRKDDHLTCIVAWANALAIIRWQSLLLPRLKVIRKNRFAEISGLGTVLYHGILMSITQDAPFRCIAFTSFFGGVILNLHKFGLETNEFLNTSAQVAVNCLLFICFLIAASNNDLAVQSFL